MRYTKRFALLVFSLIFLMGVYVSTASAQRRVYRRPLIIRTYDPWFYSNRYWWDNDPYFYDPYLREQREKHYKQKDVKDARAKLNKNREKYYSDGVLTAKEEENLAKRQRDYEKKVASLDKFNRDHD